MDTPVKVKWNMFEGKQVRLVEWRKDGKDDYHQLDDLHAGARLLAHPVKDQPLIVAIPSSPTQYSVNLLNLGICLDCSKAGPAGFWVFKTTRMKDNEELELVLADGLFTPDILW